ncbi:SLC13 family permease [Liberiplasma polymorphum]|uniref:SLC13 family permease n=1 Tax=Liberiplasma polymorphum TaxID=3374570 RepID=UPI0037755795
MTLEIGLIYGLLALILVFFAWGKYRYDIVALVALLLAVILKLVHVEDAFVGFSHPAVITVIAVLIISRGLTNSGIVDFIVRLMGKIGDNELIQISALIFAVTIASAFMNNVGALALFMPVAIRMARKNERSPSLYLMPIAFASLLGGMMTLIGTPPNIIIASYRAELNGTEPFKMFEFLPVGGILAAFGAIFLIIFSQFVMPNRKGKMSRDEMFEIQDYITELKVPEKAKVLGDKVKVLESLIDGDIYVISHMREGVMFKTVSPYRHLRENDLIVIRANTNDLQELLDASGLIISETEKLDSDQLANEEIMVMEVAITSNSSLVDKSARSLNLRQQFGTSLLGVARSGGRLRATPGGIKFKAGDVLLLQGGEDSIHEMITNFNLLPLQERGLRIGKISNVLEALAIFFVAIILTTFGVLPAQIAFLLAAVVMVIFKFVSLKEMYESIDWPIIVLLGAMIPISNALETTGAANLIADALLIYSQNFTPIISLVIVMVITMLLSNVVNNAAAVLLMAPIAVGIALGLGTNIDPFLMGVAISASSAFLTPIGHQSNTLVMGPGGYKFSDYSRLGVPLSIAIILIGVPLIVWIWPL